ncbi:hypothetical protein Aperf_G00000083246 [Anoplocephala perfoliata]
MRINQRAALVCFFLVFSLFIFKYLDTSDYSSIRRIAENRPLVNLEGQSYCIFKRLNCKIHGYSSSGCFQIDNSTLAVDVKHLASWYEAEGSLNLAEGVLEISYRNDQSSSPLILKKHSALGAYMGQSSFSEPERKPHILLIDPDHSVPISRQWDAKGHPYPVQIAQYGLAYYAHFQGLLRLKSRLDEEPSSVVDIMPYLAKQLSCLDQNRSCSLGGNSVSIAYKLKNTEASSRLTGLIASGVNWPRDSRLIIQASLTSNSSLVEIHFTCSGAFGDGTVISSSRYWALGYSQSILKIVYFLRKCQNITLLQNLDMIIMKGVASIKSNQRATLAFRSLLLDPIIGKGLIVNKVELQVGSWVKSLSRLNELLLFVPIVDDREDIRSTRQLNVNMEFARRRLLSAAEWLLANQWQDGSWRVEARRVFTQEIFLKPGWCSAMGQGQAISLLVRVARLTNEPRFLAAASRALGPFSRPIDSDSSNCGVRANFLDQSALPWFEEYPATPNVFVLNGFIFSLVGLYDLKKASLNGSEDGVKAAQLLAEGLETLVHVLPLFDSGTGSFYDLRHLRPEHALRLSPQIDRLKVGGGITRVSLDDQNLRALLKGGPNRARWQYHRIHLMQLFQLANVIAPQYASTWNLYFDRWLAYSWGFRSGHN